jgi:hypothetical protein
MCRTEVKVKLTRPTRTEQFSYSVAACDTHEVQSRSSLTSLLFVFHQHVFRHHSEEEARRTRTKEVRPCITQQGAIQDSDRIALRLRLSDFLRQQAEVRNDNDKLRRTTTAIHAHYHSSLRKLFKMASNAASLSPFNRVPRASRPGPVSPIISDSDVDHPAVKFRRSFLSENLSN